jgi:hypothetical protein
MDNFFNIAVGCAVILGTVIAYFALKKSVSTRVDGPVEIDVSPDSNLAKLLKDRTKSSNSNIGAAVPKADIYNPPVLLKEGDISKQNFGSDEYFADLISGLKSKENGDEISISVRDE